MRFEAAVDVMPRKEISDPQGQTIERALPGIGFNGIESVRVGKRINLVISAATQDEARATLDEACRTFLTNPAIEEFDITLTELEPVG